MYIFLSMHWNFEYFILFADPIIIQSKGWGQEEALDAPVKKICNAFVEYAILKDAALLHSGNRREVSLMVQILTDIIVAVIAQVIADRLCKWLDSCHKGQ
mgnify:CR=1 FL=1